MPEGKHPSSHLVLATLPGAVMAIVATVDLTAGPEVGFLPLVSLGPAFAGLVGTWRRTAVIGAVALLLCTTLGIYDGLLDSRRGYTALASVGGVTAGGVTAAGMRGRREAELATMRSIAEVAQRVLLRPVPRTAGPLQIAVSYTSAVADARIGGDLYEVVATPHGVRVIVGDVQGKGLAAVESAAVVLGAFREAAHDEPDLLALGARLDRSISRDLNSEKFVTAVLAEVGPEEGRAVFLNYCCTPTASARPATRTVPSTRSATGRRSCGPPTPRTPSTCCAKTWHNTPMGFNTTTLPCCCCATTHTPRRPGPPEGLPDPLRPLTDFALCKRKVSPGEVRAPACRGPGAGSGGSAPRCRRDARLQGHTPGRAGSAPQRSNHVLVVLNDTGEPHAVVDGRKCVGRVLHLAILAQSRLASLVGPPPAPRSFRRRLCPRCSWPPRPSSRPPNRASALSPPYPAYRLTTPARGRPRVA